MPEFKMYPNLITDFRMEYVAGCRHKKKEYKYDGKWMQIGELIKFTGIEALTEERKIGILRNRFCNHPFNAKYLLCNKTPAGLNFTGTDKYANRRKPRSTIKGKPQWGDLKGKLSGAKKAVSDRLAIEQIPEGSWENKHLKGA